MDVFEFDTYDPIEYDESDKGIDWELHAERLRTIMARCLRVELSGSSVKDSFLYKDFLKTLGGKSSQQYAQFDQEQQ